MTRHCSLQLLAAAALTIAGAISAGVSEAQEPPCVTSDLCIQRCKSSWKDSKWKDAQDCIKRLPCSKYPKRCIVDTLPKLHGDPPTNN